ncbi:hypothetical protein DUI87_27689 [Hirundo rustica rustica]|uniref:Uncharacterized protein n=1 Tax=Hirundo rustica rustica TaxID=333673 RepID=A0A3M0J9T5_HIRRU|nr:hypothetical protein DUI87_27689 [Hirundo rustica rustica]
MGELPCDDLSRYLEEELDGLESRAQPGLLAALLSPRAELLHKNSATPETACAFFSQRGANPRMWQLVLARIVEYSLLEGTHKDHGAQFLHRHPNIPTLGIPGSAVQRLLELWQPWLVLC